MHGLQSRINIRKPDRRAAFTLLEMMLAMAIGVLLLIGLYVALNVHLNATDAGRVQVDQAQVYRNVLKMFTTDIQNHLATLDAYPSASTSSSSTSGTTGTSAAGTGTTATTTTAGMGATSGTTGTSTTAAASTATGTTTTGTVPFTLGVQGGADWIAIYDSTMPRAVSQSQNANSNVQAQDSDLRRYAYYLIPSSDGSGGLARQEITAVLSTDVVNSVLPPSGPDDYTKILTNRVIALGFEYFDGTNWQTTWDGTQPGSDGVTPVGPPVAIRITMSVARADNLTAGVSDSSVRQYQDVIQIPTAAFYNSQQYSNTTTGTTSSTGGSMP